MNRHRYKNGDPALEEQNDRETDELKQKIKSLRTVAIDIGGEVARSTRLINEMDNDFDNAGGFLGKAMGRVKKLSKGSHNHIFWYLILFSLVVFLFIWLLMKF